ncbi:chorion class CB protein PC404-like [Pararge aegeria]|uniref:Chorion class B family 3 n=1 Tax=Pararge aegeria TaxID=116150 RepID=S4PUB6_9NEOP|nr:chorion class CB protein PC404-like [Pararge aegeria]
MASKVVFVLCLQMALMKYTLGQCIPVAAVPESCGPIFGVPSAFTSGLAMQMPWIPSPSFSVSSDDLGVIGTVTVRGSLPFLGTVSMAGELPAVGQGTVMYNCGNGDIGIVREVPFSGMVAPMGAVCY